MSDGAEGSRAHRDAVAAAVVMTRGAPAGPSGSEDAVDGPVTRRRLESGVLAILAEGEEVCPLLTHPSAKDESKSKESLSPATSVPHPLPQPL